MRIFFAENNGRCAAFFCDTLGIYTVTPEEKSILEGVKQDCFNFSVYSRCERIIQDESLHLEQMEQKDCDHNPFYTLILNVANTCNMRCSYCFANHGEYASRNGIMRIQTALQAVDACYSKHGFIGEIKFFGGEPLIAVRVIQAVCEYVISKYNAGYIQRLPEFRVISNGTIMDDDVCSLIVKYNLQYIVSMDGASALHDSCRQMRDGNGSYDRIMKNLAYLKAKTGRIPSGIEITWNGIHERHNTKVIDVIRFLEGTTGVDASRINLSCVMTKAGSEESLINWDYAMEGYLDEIFEEKRQTGRDYADTKFRGLIRMLRNRMRSGNQICEAGSGCISVSAYGNIYPCLMFTDNADMLMGTVSRGLYEYADHFLKELKKTKRLLTKPCRECWANRVCRQCMGINRFQTGKLNIPLKEQCIINRKRIEKAILAISEGLY